MRKSPNNPREMAEEKKVLRSLRRCNAKGAKDGLVIIQMDKS
jgi:hypothetical protein